MPVNFVALVAGLTLTSLAIAAKNDDPSYCNARPAGKPGEAVASKIDPTLELGAPVKGLAKSGYGADSATPVTEALVKALIARYESPPMFWGRYISNRPERLLRPKELEVLGKYKIKVLPLAQQTLRFNDKDEKTKSTLETGRIDGECNALAFIDAFAIDEADIKTYHLYLNIEVDEQTPVNANYFKGWVAGLEAGVKKRKRKIALRPAVYIGTLGSLESWKALTTATSNFNLEIDTVWIARYGSGYAGAGPLPCKDIDVWRDHSKAGGLAFPSTYVGAWQYQENCRAQDAKHPVVDISIVAPDDKARTVFLNGLVDSAAAASRQAGAVKTAKLSSPPPR